MGNPNNFNNSIPSSLLFAVVTTVISKPKLFLTFSGEISGKAICSFIAKVKFPFGSKDLGSIPRKSRDLGRAI